MKVLVTGASGFIGRKLALELVRQGYSVNAIVRSQAAKADLEANQVCCFEGDLLDYLSLEKAVAGCEVVFHLAAFARMWDKDPRKFYQVNVRGTENMLTAAKRAQVRKFIFTSTAGVFGPSVTGIVTEESQRSLPYFNRYEETKASAENLVLNAADKDSEVFVLNPTRVYGPGLMSESNGVTRMVSMYLDGKFRFIPGDGKSVGNYVYVDDVVAGHLLVLKNGKSGHRYILGGENISLNGFFETLMDVTALRRRLYHIPRWVLLFVAFFMDARSFLFGKAPLVTRKWLRRFLYNWEVSSDKAANDLEYEITPLNIGLKQTINQLLEAGQIIHR